MGFGVVGPLVNYFKFTQVKLYSVNPNLSFCFQLGNGSGGLAVCGRMHRQVSEHFLSSKVL